MRFLLVALVTESFSSSIGQLFYGALPPGTFPALEPGPIPFYGAAQPAYTPNPKFYGPSQVPLSYYQNYPTNVKGFQPPMSTKQFSNPLTQHSRPNSESTKSQQQATNFPATSQESGPDFATKTKKQPIAQYQKRTPEETAPMTPNDTQERQVFGPVNEPQEETSIPSESDDNGIQTPFVPDPAYAPNPFPQPGFSQPMPPAAYGVSNVRFGSVEHSCKEVKICVPIDPKNCWTNEQEVVQNFVFNQTDTSSMFQSPPTEPAKKKRKIKKIVLTIPTTAPPERKVAPSMIISKRKHTTAVTPAPYKIYELADPNQKIIFEPGKTAPSGNGINK